MIAKAKANGAGGLSGRTQVETGQSPPKNFAFLVWCIPLETVNFRDFSSLKLFKKTTVHNQNSMSLTQKTKNLNIWLWHDHLQL